MSKRGNTVGTAYVDLVPSAEGFSDGIKKAIDEGSAAGSKSDFSALSSLGTGFAMGIGSAAFGAVTDCDTPFTKTFPSSATSGNVIGKYNRLLLLP